MEPFRIYSFTKGAVVRQFCSILDALNIPYQDSQEKTGCVIEREMAASPIIVLAGAEKPAHLNERIFAEALKSKRCLLLFALDVHASDLAPFFQQFDDLSTPLQLDEYYVAGLINTFRQHYIQMQHVYRSAFGHPLLNQALIGQSDAYRHMTRMLAKVAETDAGIYIHGETGTGKEVTARSIHYLSSRCDGPFIPVNCGALSNELMLSELFGHERGAFTGAANKHVGLIEHAHQGSLFLDEVDSLSEKAQVTLLRFLQEGELRPVGATQVKQVDVRVIAASNTSLEQLIAQKRFRQDLLFRLDILRVNLPPLRERDRDIFWLAQFFLRKLKDAHGPLKTLDTRLLNWMMQYSWPGNVRELDNFIQRAYLLSDSSVISSVEGICTERDLNELEPDLDLSDSEFGSGSLAKEKDRFLRSFEKDYLTRVLTKTKGNISVAAKIAEKERSCFMRLMKKYGLQREHFLNESHY